MIFHGIAEEEEEDFKIKVPTIFTHLDEQLLFTVPCRVRGFDTHQDGHHDGGVVGHGG